MKSGSRFGLSDVIEEQRFGSTGMFAEVNGLPATSQLGTTVPLWLCIFSRCLGTVRVDSGNNPNVIKNIFNEAPHAGKTLMPVGPYL